MCFPEKSEISDYESCAENISVHTSCHYYVYRNLTFISALLFIVSRLGQLDTL